jgi:hypothetical protein
MNNPVPPHATWLAAEFEANPLDDMSLFADLMSGISALPSS